MANTGYKGWNTLEEYDVNTGRATGNTKPNVEGDPDYVSPVYDTSYCPLPYLVISPSSITIEGGVEIFTINVTSNISWTAISEAPWMTVTSGFNGVGNGVVEVTVDKNSTQNPRVGNIKIKGDEIIKFCGVTQNVTHQILINPTQLIFPPEGGTQSVTITADSAWTASNLSANPSTGGAGTATVNITVLAKDETSEQTQLLYFELNNNDGVAELEIIQ